jgi:hypothetical protein
MRISTDNSSPHSTPTGSPTRQTTTGELINALQELSTTEGRSLLDNSAVASHIADNHPSGAVFGDLAPLVEHTQRQTLAEQLDTIRRDTSAQANAAFPHDTMLRTAVVLAREILKNGKGGMANRYILLPAKRILAKLPADSDDRLASHQQQFLSVLDAKQDTDSVFNDFRTVDASSIPKDMLDEEICHRLGIVATDSVNQDQAMLVALVRSLYVDVRCNIVHDALDRIEKEVSDASQLNLHEWFAVKNTATALLISEVLVNGEGMHHEGKIDTTAATDLKSVLETHPARANGNGLSHQKHLVRLLTQMEKAEPAVQSVIDTVNQACEHHPLVEVDMIRATLNLEPHEPATPTAARIAARRGMVAAIFGELRQRQSGSCFATAPLIRIQKRCMEMMARHLRSGLETGILDTNQSSGVNPKFNQSVNLPNAKRRLKMDDSGVVHGTGFALHRHPSMRAALKALGIGEDHIEEKVGAAVKRIGQKGGEHVVATVQDVLETVLMMRYELSIDQLTHLRQTICSWDTSSDATLLAQFEKELKAALDAFAGKRDVRLLRAYENTLASLATEEEMDHLLEALCAPQPDSLYGAMFSAVQARSAGMSKSDAEELLDSIAGKIVTATRNRFHYEFDPDVATAWTENDSLPLMSGARLHFSLEPDGSDRSQPLRSAVQFQYAIQRMIQDIERELHADGNFHSDDIQAVMQMLCDHAMSEKFATNTTQKISALARESMLDYTRKKNQQFEQSPWHLQSLGGSARRVLSAVFSIPVDAIAMEEIAVAGQISNGAILLEKLIDFLKRMHIRDKKSNGSETYTIHCDAKSHTFALTPWYLTDAMASASTATWIAEKLLVPGLACAARKLDRPAIDALIDEIGAALNLAAVADVDAVSRLKSEMQDGATPVELHDALENALQGWFSGDENLMKRQQLLQRADGILMTELGAPAFPIADTNSSVQGQDVFLVVAYNVGKNTSEVWERCEDGTHLRGCDQDQWLNTTWLAYADPASYGD